MAIKVSTLSKNDVGYAIEVDVSYVCRYCNESVSDTISLSKDGLGSSVIITECECPNCGSCVDLDIDL
ncbi:MAG: hypothetical protein IJF75_05120 [Clostridia bacterium]|nr:hypothetical protein [Clostridia bacterium]